ncbi:MAG: hypothetical protein KAW67_01140 [Candidatus Eisenbacteria sp.]|nr:hypothetical protein [Candidatus Eisenbacteria bacterium]
MMRQTVLLLWAIVVFALSAPSSGQYQIPVSVIGSGGGSASGVFRIAGGEPGTEVSWQATRER